MRGYVRTCLSVHARVLISVGLSMYVHECV